MRGRIVKYKVSGGSRFSDVFYYRGAAYHMKASLYCESRGFTIVTVVRFVGHGWISARILHELSCVCG